MLGLSRTAIQNTTAEILSGKMSRGKKSHVIAVCYPSASFSVESPGGDSGSGPHTVMYDKAPHSGSTLFIIHNIHCGRVPLSYPVH